MRINLTSNHNAIFTRTPVQVGDLSNFTHLRSSGLRPYIEMTYEHGNSHKFWRIEVVSASVAGTASAFGAATQRRWGRIGTQGQSKGFGGSCEQEVFWAKVRKGYDIQKPTGHFPVSIGEVRSNGDLIELVDRDGNVVWADTPRNALKVLAVCRPY